MKKLLASLLAFAMVVTGLYIVKPADVKAATTVDKAMLGVEAFVTADKVDGKYILRFVSTVDSLNYKNVGFDITYPDQSTETITMKRVFSKIDSSIGEMDNGEEDVFGFSPSLISSKSKYFMTTKIVVNDEAGDYTATAFCTTKDGTKVTGATKVVSLSDLQGKTVNVTVPVAFAENATLTATYGDKTAASATLVKAGEGFSIVRIQLADNAEAASLKSVTKFTVSDGTTSKDVLYRNYKTTHKNPATNVEANNSTDYLYDTSWYDVNKDASEFVLATSADLYGFAVLVNNGNTFAGKTVKLISDVTLNDGKVVKATATEAPTWVKDEGAPVYNWPIIGGAAADKSFAGTFDGCGNTVSGMYKLGGSSGFFGNVTGTVTIKNLQLVNGYSYSGSYTHGGLISTCKTESKTTIENVYVDVTTNSDGRYFAGFVATAETKATISLDKCWYAGEIYSRRSAGASEPSEIAAAFVAYHGSNDNTIKITNSINTGNFVINGGNYGSFIGYTGGGSKTYVIQNCVDLGTATLKLATTNAGILIGATGNGTLTISNVYVSDITGRLASFYGKEGELEKNETNVKKVAVSSLKNLSASEIKAFFPMLSSEATSPWTTASDGTLVLKVFKDWLYPTAPVEDEWVDEPEPETAVPDTSWYSDSATEFTLTKRAQFYGFAKLVNEGKTFAGKTVKLGKDITLNDNIDVNAWKTTAPENNWTPIGTSTNKFAGIFDGQGYTISGLYLNASAEGAGLFGWTDGPSELKNFKLKDSLMMNSEPSLGIVGKAVIVKMENIYTNAVYISTATDRADAAGFVGTIARIDPEDHDVIHTKFINCWFDGTIEIPNSGRKAGGFLSGMASAASVGFYNCLSTGTISGGYHLGGFFGAKDIYARCEIHNSLSLVTINSNPTNTAKEGFYGAFFGDHGASTYNSKMYNSYSTVNKNVGSGKSDFNAATYTKTLDELKTTDVLTLFPLLEGETASPWEAVSGSTPVLKGLK